MANYVRDPDGTIYDVGTNGVYRRITVAEWAAVPANQKYYTSAPVSAALASYAGTGATTDPFGGLTGDNRDAYAAVTGLLKQYGLESLAPTVLGLVQQNYSQDTVTVLLQETPEYKARFAGNAARVKADLPVLSPAEYLSVESSYRSVMSAAGLPKSFYDQPSDFQKFIEGDMSATELNDRVGSAAALVNAQDPTVRAEFAKFYTTGDMVAYALDPVRAAPIVGQQVEAAKIAATAASQNIDINSMTAEQLVGAGVTAAQSQQGFGNVAQLSQVTGKLSELYGGTYTQDTAIQDVLLNNQTAAAQRARLASAERGQFGGTSAVGGSFSTAANTLGVKKPGAV